MPDFIPLVRSSALLAMCGIIGFGCSNQNRGAAKKNDNNNQTNNGTYNQPYNDGTAQNSQQDLYPTPQAQQWDQNSFGQSPYAQGQNPYGQGYGANLGHYNPYTQGNQGGFDIGNILGIFTGLLGGGGGFGGGGFGGGNYAGNYGGGYGGNNFGNQNYGPGAGFGQGGGYGGYNNAGYDGSAGGGGGSGYALLGSPDEADHDQKGADHE